MTFAWNMALVTFSAMASFGGVYNGEVDMDQIITSFSATAEDGSRVEAVPWNNDLGIGSVARFQEQLIECGERMDHLAMHTPKYFLCMALKRKHSDEGWEDEAAARANTSQLF